MGEGFHMIKFLDQNGNKVELSFVQHAFEEEAKHVLVICQYEGGWLLTNHKKRGLEFPGGKIEPGETVEEAARREVYEETGAKLDALYSIGEYKVADPNGAFVKAVFFGKVMELHATDTYFETNGPVLVYGDLLEKRFGEEYSFIMKDQVVAECIQFILIEDLVNKI
jgi:8-oxo-dGTP diphosphatase